MGYSDANSTEMVRHTSHPVIDLMESHKELPRKAVLCGWFIHCVLKKKTKAYEAYGKPEIKERHRHRYEFNDEYLDSFEKAGMLATGVNPDTGLIEIIEIEKHKWFVGVQYHPEYKSTVLNPHPLFVAFVKSTLSQ